MTENHSIILVAKISAQAFVDGANITINGAACMNSADVENLKSITFGFIGAYWPPLTPEAFQVSPMAGIVLSQHNPVSGTIWVCPKNAVEANSTKFFGNPTSIVFRAANNYLATIELEYTNQTMKIYTYPDFVLPIQSSEALRQDQVNTGIGAATFVGFLFVVFDLIPKFTNLKFPNRKTDSASKKNKKRKHRH